MRVGRRGVGGGAGEFAGVGRGRATVLGDWDTACGRLDVFGIRVDARVVGTTGAALLDFVDVKIGVGDGGDLCGWGSSVGLSIYNSRLCKMLGDVFGWEDVWKRNGEGWVVWDGRWNGR